MIDLKISVCYLYYHFVVGRKRKEHVTHESPQKKKRTDKIIEIVPYHATPATVTLTEQKGISNAFGKTLCSFLKIFIYFLKNFCLRNSEHKKYMLK